MPLNNTGLYDAVIAGIALSNGAWASETNASDYAPEANAAVAIATEVDAGISPIVGGATVSQRMVMQTVTKGCMSGRVAISMQPTDYSAVAAGIIAVYTEFVTKLQDGSGGNVFQNLSNVIFVDGTTVIPTLSETGNIESPFALLSSAISAVPTEGAIWLTPLDYTAQGTIAVTKDMAMRTFGVGTVLSAVSLADAVIVFDIDKFTITGNFTGGSTGGRLSITRCTLGGKIIAANYNVTLEDDSIADTVSAADLSATNCKFFRAITLSDTTGLLKECDFDVASITFSGAAGIITMDGYTYHNWLVKGGTITNGSIVVNNSLLSASVAVTVPILLNGEVNYVNVDVSSTVLKGITTNTPIGANPTEDLAPGSTGGAAYCPAARVSATNTVRLTVVGPITPAKSTHFVITRLAAK
jgi:hypothetical protein